MTDSPKRVRVANVQFLDSSGYRLLSKLDWVDYRECSPLESAEQLADGTVDVALIPFVEFVQHGGYRALRYGICSHEQMQSVLLISQVPLKELESVVLDKSSRTGALLLQILLRDFYPDLAEKLEVVHANAADVPGMVHGTRGGLVIGDLGWMIRKDFPIYTDLTQLWFEKTGTPMIFAIWAYRPDSLSPESVEKLETSLTDALTHQELFARDWAERRNANRDAAARFVVENVRYVIDAAVEGGANEFIRRANAKNLLPRYTLRVHSRSTVVSPEPLDSLLARAAAGERISVAEALFISEGATLAELALASDIRRNDLAKIGGAPWFRNFELAITFSEGSNLTIDSHDEQRLPSYVVPWSEIGDRVAELPRLHSQLVSLMSVSHPDIGLEYFTGLLEHLRARFPMRFALLSAEEILDLALGSGLTVTEILRRLKTATLDLLGGGVSHLLVRSAWSSERRGRSYADWIEVHRSAHALGLSTICTLPIAKSESWADRLSHLAKLRQLQDESGGFAFLSVAPVGPDLPSPSEYLAGVAIARLFIDNIPYLEASPFGYGTPVAELSLNFGASCHVQV
ncbi:MAG: hypothetical protein IT290_05025 [Deltaproteobacteria bacterium]|nr:hypothetical protein [Deltaproteobacteria bacterium]